MAQQLSRRLGAVCTRVRQGHAVLDVGCDHAYAAIWLVEQGIAPVALASDIRGGPLAAAREHIAEAGLSDRIRTVLADGIPAQYRDFTGDLPVTVLLAGMGGLMMKGIIEDAAARGELPEEVSASPQRDIDAFRRCLAGQGYAIVDEAFLEEEGKYYTVIRAERGREVPALSPAEERYGPCLIREADPLYVRYLRAKAGQLASIKAQLVPDTERKKKRLEKLTDELSVLGDVLRSMEEHMCIS